MQILHIYISEGWIFVELPMKVIKGVSIQGCHYRCRDITDHAMTRIHVQLRSQLLPSDYKSVVTDHLANRIQSATHIDSLIVNIFLYEGFFYPHRIKSGAGSNLPQTMKFMQMRSADLRLMPALGMPGEVNCRGNNTVVFKLVDDCIRKLFSAFISRILFEYPHRQVLLHILPVNRAAMRNDDFTRGFVEIC